MKRQFLFINIFSIIFILGLIGYCGKKEEKTNQTINSFSDPQQVAEVICNKMFDCLMEEAKAMNMPNADIQIKTMKDNCKSAMVKYQEKEVKKEAKDTPSGGPTQEEITACFNAIKDATCEQIKNNQVPACNELNKYTVQ